jgi:hypothetical protein
MNLLEILRARVDDLPEGDYMQGLKAVLQHIEVAGRHLERGQTDADDTAFTDAIYRTNQAFEGSLKEAFRVLTARDPAGESPYNIENYLQQQNVLRPRVLAQLTNYRKEWRNPSTHDYRLDFDEDEALLAIVTVSAFAIVLIDQITERISFEQAKVVAAEQPTTPPVAQSLLEQVSALVEQFTIQFNQTHADKADIREVEIVGALAGFLAGAAPELRTQVEAVLSHEKAARADFLVSSGEERLILEVKRGRGFSLHMMEDATQQVIRYMAISGINQAILFIYNSPNKGKVTRFTQPLLFENAQIVVISAQ